MSSTAIVGGGPPVAGSTAVRPAGGREAEAATGGASQHLSTRSAPFSVHLRDHIDRASNRGAGRASMPGPEGAGASLAREDRALGAEVGDAPLNGAPHSRGRARKRDDDEGESASADAASAAATDPAPALDELDPMARLLRSPMSVSIALAPHTPPPDPAREIARASLEQLMSRFVRRIAWSGDGHAGSATLELGAGELEGATLTLHARGGDVQVSLDLPPGVDRGAWRERIGERLSARGLHVTSLEVT